MEEPLPLPTRNKILSGPVLELLSQVGTTEQGVNQGRSLDELLELMKPIQSNSAADLARTGLNDNLRSEFAGLESLLPGISSVLGRPADSTIPGAGFTPDDPRLAPVPPGLFQNYGAGEEFNFFKPTSLGGIAKPDETSGTASGLPALQQMLQQQGRTGGDGSPDGVETSDWTGSFEDWAKTVASFAGGPLSIVTGLINQVVKHIQGDYSATPGGIADLGSIADALADDTAAGDEGPAGCGNDQPGSSSVGDFGDQQQEADNPGSTGGDGGSGGDNGGDPGEGSGGNQSGPR